MKRKTLRRIRTAKNIVLDTAAIMGGLAFAIGLCGLDSEGKGLLIVAAMIVGGLAVFILSVLLIDLTDQMYWRAIRKKDRRAGEQ